MRTRDVVIICVTALVIAWLKYVLPFLERAHDRDLQREILRAMRATPSIQVVPEPEPQKL